MATTLRLTLRRFLADERGATAIEYSIVAAGIGVVISTTVWALGSSIKTELYQRLSNMF